MIRKNRNGYYGDEGDLRENDEFFDDGFDGYDEGSEYTEENDFDEYDGYEEETETEEGTEYAEETGFTGRDRYEETGFTGEIRYEEEPRFGVDEFEDDEYEEDEYEEEPREESAEYEDEPRNDEYEESAEYEEDPENESQYEEYNTNPRKGYVKPTGRNRFEDIKLTEEEIYGEEEDDEEYASSGAGMKIAIALAAAVLVLVAVTIVTLVIFKKGDKALPGAGEVVANAELMGAGENIREIDLIGSRGLIAALDAKRAEVRALEIAEAEAEEEEEVKEYNEGEIDNDVTIALETVTVLKDLKVKVVNKKTGKLFANIPFSITVSYPDGTTKTWTDDDKDGIIYYTDLKAGKYKVHFNELTDEKYAGYKLPDDVSADVTDKIEYKAVDVSDEILDASQVNESKEDTVRGGADTESTESVTNTVEWVESTSKETYVAVDRSTISIPSFVSSLDYSSARIYRTTAVDPALTYTLTLDPTSVSLTVGQSAAVTPTVDPAGPTVNWASDNTGVATVADGTITGVAEGTCTVTATLEGSSISQSVQVTVTQAASITVAGSASVEAGKSTALGISYTGMQKNEIAVSSSDASVATASISADGTTVVITGVKAGSATITLSKNDGTGAATVAVTVTAPNYGIALGNASIDLYSGKSATVGMTLTNLDSTKITAVSSNTSLASVAITDNSKITITAGAVADGGSVTITVQKSDDANVKASVTVNVVGSGTAVKTNDGKDVYVANSDGTYRVATYADYLAGTELYTKTLTYTGWQTINGETYFYTADGKPVTGEQTIQGVVYNFDSKGCLQVGGGVLGIDVSKWNGSINWAKVKESGVSFVIIRIGYRGSTKGGLIDDSAFKSNIEGALNAGLKVGVYWVTQAVNEVEAIEEASAVLDRISGYRISYPVFLDVESSGGRGDAIDKATRTVVCKTFCQTIQNSGYTAGIYANKNWMTNYIDASQLTGYKIWVAQYYKECTYKGSYSMWQYTESGSINGINGKVDLNLSYLGY